MVIINNKVMEEELVKRINELISGISSGDIKSVKECYALYKDKFDLIDTSTRLRIEEALGICPSGLSDSIRPERLEGESVYEYKWRRKVVGRKTNPKYRKVMFFQAINEKSEKGSTFEKSKYSSDDLMSADMNARMRLMGVDVNKLSSNK